ITLALFLAILFSFAIDRSGRLVHSIGAFWCRIILALSGVRVRVDGIENIPEGGPVIFLSNHQGAFDIPALQGFIPVQFRWVAKKSLFSIPVIGWTMSLAGYIGIDRDNPAEAMRNIEEASGKIRGGTSVLVFPEGTRSDTGRLLPFKRGAFVLVQKSGVPVVPVAIQGTKDIMKRGRYSINPSEVRISFGRPMGPEEGGGDMRRRARSAIEGLLQARGS
ncbi:MAG: lysophospholipid acyltransferase family protein, partial [Deltaproteobacteria bacterium]|nr:lysophospholipid acyltransferase family protein [Deltaproteobacteria bacterium]